MPRATPDSRTSPLGQNVAESLETIRYVLLVAAPLGLLVGCAIAAYDWTINELMWKHILTLPIEAQIVAPIAGMMLTGIILQLFRVRTSSMADEVVRVYHETDTHLASRESFAKLGASITTIGLGGSAGMEGASKWVGATIGEAVQRFLNFLGFRALKGETRTTLLAGGSAAIGAIFRAPLSGAIMGVESPYKHDLAHEALLPALVASATSFWAYTRFRPSTPYFPIHFSYALQTRDLLVAIPLGLSAGLASHFFLAVTERVKRVSEKSPIPIAVRTTIAGILVAGIAWVAWKTLGAPVTLQAGLPLANDMLNGHYALEACAWIFVLKMLATSLTFGSGGVGGYFVPTATLGAAIGACWDLALGSSQPGVFTLLGIAAFSGASYNSLLFAAVFIAEATGNVSLVVPALIACSVAFVTAAGVSNSRSQRRRRGDPGAVTPSP